MERPSLDVLLVEDNPGDARLIEESLSESHRTRFVVERASRLSEALAKLEPGRFDAVLLDLSLPDSHGLESVARLREHINDLPIVVLTGLEDEALAWEAPQHGAQDYLLKSDLGSSLLSRTLHYAVERQSILTRLKHCDQLKSEFLATTSHEMRTPIAVIREYIGLLRDRVPGPINAEQAECLQAAERNCMRLCMLLDDLLDMARIESGRMRLQRRRTAPARLVEEIHGDFEARGATKEQRVELELGDELPDLLCDPHRTSQVLTNLLENAHKFTPEGGRIRLRVLPVDGHVRFEVVDDGPGLDERDREHVFEAFTQLDRRDGPGAQGTGLGLAISKRLVDLQGGEIGVDSEPGKGSTFFFTVPRYPEGEAIGCLLQQRLRMTRTAGQPLTLALIKPREAAESLEVLARTVLRDPSDEVHRIGDEGIVALLLEAGEPGAHVAVERVCSALATLHGRTIPVSAGVAEKRPDQSNDEWIAEAQSRMRPVVDVPPEEVRVLVVVGGCGLTENVAKTLEEHLPGSKVTVARDGLDAAIRFGRLRPELVVLSARQASPDPAELIRSMATHESRGTRFLVVADETDPAPGALRELGSVEILAPPIVPGDLIESLKRDSREKSDTLALEVVT